MSTIETKLKAAFSEQSRKNDVYEAGIGLLTAKLDTVLSRVDVLEAKKENIDAVKTSHISFTKTFNETIKTVDDKMKTSESLHSEKLSQLAERLDAVKADMQKKFVSTDNEIKTLKSAFEF